MGDHGEVVEWLGLVRVCKGALLVVSPKRPSPHQRHSSSSPRWSTQARHAHTPAHTLNQNAYQIKASKIKAMRTQITASELMPTASFDAVFGPALLTKQLVGL